MAQQAVGLSPCDGCRKMAACYADPAAPSDGAWCEACWRAWQPEPFENGAALAGTSPPAAAAAAAADCSPLGTQEKPSAPVMAWLTHEFELARF